MGVAFIQECGDSRLLEDVSIVPSPNTGIDTLKIIGSARLQSFDCLNCNRRVYSSAIGGKILEEATNRINDTNTFFGGELDHPLVEALSSSAALKRQMCVMLKECSHKFNRVWMEGNALCGTCETLSTPNGRTMSELAVVDKIPIAFSARALGKTKPAPKYGAGAVEVCAPICIAAYDCIQSPSHRGSVMTEVTSIIRNSKDMSSVSEGMNIPNDDRVLSESFSDISIYRDIFLADENAFDFLVENMIYGDGKNYSNMNPEQEKKFVQGTMDSILSEYLNTTPDTIDGKSSVAALNEANVNEFLHDYSYRRKNYNKVSDLRASMKKFLDL